MAQENEMADGRGLEPVLDADHERPADERNLGDGVALCLSGGGYRAMLFHVGSLLRLNELGQLRTLKRISSVSGGSITAAVLGMGWKRLDFSDASVARNLDEVLVEPLRKMADTTIDKGSIIGGLLRPGRSISQNVVRAYDRYLFDGATLQDLPADAGGPRFVINATNVQTGKLFRFSRPFEGDYTVGLWRDPSTSLADAVAASSAFPPILSPHTLEPAGVFDDSTQGVNSDRQFRSRLWMSDGGVYDNLGLETAWKRYRTILVSDGGGSLRLEPKPKRDWVLHGIRVSSIVDGQVRALRKRQLIDGYVRGLRSGAYWRIGADIEDYDLDDPVAIDPAQRNIARLVPTRLAALDDTTQKALIDWGYAITDTAMRRWVLPAATLPHGLPV